MIKFLRALGFGFHLDWDGSLLIEEPDYLSASDVLEALGAWREEWRNILARQVTYEAQRDRSFFHGGPSHGKRHGRDARRAEYFVGCNVARAKWAVYKVVPDGRAFFQGYATSERKALNGDFVRSGGVGGENNLDTPS